MNASKMTIFWLTYEYDPRVQHDMGGFRATWEKAEALERLGHRVIVFAPRLTKKPTETKGEVVWYPILDLPVIRPLLAYLLLFTVPLRAARDVRPDLIYVTAGLSPLSILLARLLRCPVIFELNGDSAHQAKLRGERVRAALARAFYTSILPKGDGVVVVSEELRLTLKDQYHLPDERIRVVPNGANLDLMRPLPPPVARGHIGLEPDCPTVGFAGTFFHYQGIAILVEAAPLILARFPRVRFLLVGDGEMRQAWEALIQGKGLSTSFHFTGQVPYRDVALYINAMDVALAPLISRRGPTSPLKLFDYWACGRPVVASDLQDLGPHLRQSGGAIPVPPEDPQALADAVCELLGDEVKRETLGNSGRHFVETQHSWVHVSEQLEQIFCDALRDGRRE